MKFIEFDKEKGRGVVADEDIEEGEFVVEYKYSESYKPKVKPKKDRDYIKSNMGCFILEVQLPHDKGWLCLDATLNINCWGRYINHSTEPNLKIWKPMKVRDKWRVGFTAVRFIKKGEELRYNYGKQKNAPEWMKKQKVYCPLS